MKMINENDVGALEQRDRPGPPGRPKFCFVFEQSNGKTGPSKNTIFGGFHRFSWNSVAVHLWNCPFLL